MSALLYLHLANAPSDLGPAPPTRTYRVSDPAQRARTPAELAARCVRALGTATAADVAAEMLVGLSHAQNCLAVAFRLGLVNRTRNGDGDVYVYTAPTSDAPRTWSR